MVWGIEARNQGGLDKIPAMPYPPFGWIYLSHLPGNMNATLSEPLLVLSAENTSFPINSC